jgi:C4-dicarboxylate-specific signal transduction histidine kinase
LHQPKSTKWNRARLVWLTLVLALSVGLTGYLVVYWSTPVNLVFLAAALVLEIRCACLPVFGIFTSSPAIILGAGMVSSIGPVVAFGICGLVVLSRLLFLNRWQWWPGICEALCQLTALGASLGALALMPGTIPAASWTVALLFYFAVNESLGFGIALGFDPLAKPAWEQAHRSLRFANFCVALAGTAVASLFLLHHFAWLLLVPGLGLIQELVQERLRLGTARRELVQLERLSNATAPCQSAGDCFQLALGILTSSLTVRSVAFFCSPEQELASLRPEVWQSPFAKRLEMRQGREMMVDRAFKLSEPVLYSKVYGSQRIFEGEEVGVAYPLAGQGALYVGRVQGAFSLEEQQFLTGFAQRLSLALLMCQQRQAKEKALHLMSQAKVALEHEVGLLACLLDGSRKFSATLKASELLSELQSLLERNLTHHAGEVWLDPSGPSHRWGAPSVDACRELVSTVVNSGRPVAVLNFETSPFKGLAGKYASALCVPIASESQVHGGILLLSHRVSGFAAEQQQLLWALGYSLAAALTNARLFSDVVQARRALEKSQVQLVHASKLNAIGEIAAGVAHEINSPLGAVVVTLELLQTVLPPEQVKNLERLERAQQSLAQARQIVSKLLLYSRRASSRVELVPLDELVKDTFILFGASWANNDFEVVNQVPPNLHGMCKASEMQQVVVHLVNNASDACRQLPVERRTVVVSARGLENEVVLEVSDQGCGIAPDHLERIFEPFVTSKAQAQGAGLGLSVCREIVQSVQGRISVESQLDKGSRFSVFLKLQ